MPHPLLKFVGNVFFVLLLAAVVPGIAVRDAYAAVWVVIIFGLLNLILRPLLVLLTLPITLITLGLFTLVLNGVLFWLTSTIVDGFSVDGFFIAFLGALFLSLLQTILDQFLERDAHDERD